MKQGKRTFTKAESITLWTMMAQAILAVVFLILLIISFAGVVADYRISYSIVLASNLLFIGVLLILLKLHVKENALLVASSLSIYLIASFIFGAISVGATLFALPIIFSTIYGNKKLAIKQTVFSIVGIFVSLIFLTILKAYSIDFLEFEKGTTIVVGEDGLYKSVLDEYLKNPKWVSTYLLTLINVYIPEIICILIVGAGSAMVAAKITKNTNEKVAREIQKFGCPSNYPFVENRNDIDIYGQLTGDDYCRGDFYDYFFVDDHHLLFYVGEVANQGVEGSLLISNIRSAIKESATEKMTLEEVVKHANDRLVQDGENATVGSLWIGILNTYNGKMHCIDAGHSTPFLKKSDGKFEQIKIKKNLMLGYSAATIFKSNILFLQEGDTVFLFSKGLLGNAEKNKEAIAKLEQDLNATNFENAKQFVENIGVLRGNLKNSQQDDIVSLALKFNERRDIYFETVIPSADVIDRFGGVILDNYSMDFITPGLEYSDTVKIECNGHELIAAVVPDYRYLKNGTTGVLVWPDKERKVIVCTFGGNFAKSMGVNKEQEFPIKISFTLYERKGYYADYITHDLIRTNVREDYPHLSDEQYANFRMVSTSNFAPNKLFRGPNPVNHLIGRNEFADQGLRRHGIKTIINLDSSMERLQSFPYFNDSYYKTCDVRIMNIDANYKTPKTSADIANIFRVFIDKNTAFPVYIHCFEGQDRTGFVIGLIECFMGASFKEIINDFMTTYYNYYGVEKGNIRYAGMSMNLISELEEVFRTDDLLTVNLQELARNFFREQGFTEDDLNKLYDALSK